MGWEVEPRNADRDAGQWHEGPGAIVIVTRRPTRGPSELFEGKCEGWNDDRKSESAETSGDTAIAIARESGKLETRDDVEPKKESEREITARLTCDCGFRVPFTTVTTKSYNQAEEKVEDRQCGIDSIQREQGALDTNVSNKMGDQ